MGHKQRVALKVQSNRVLSSLWCGGQSKHELKIEAGREYDRERPQGLTKQQYINNAMRDKIYSRETFNTYAKQLNYFFDWVQKEHKVRTLADCRQYADEWLRENIERGLSASTLHTRRSALAKLYQEPGTNFIELPERKRADITRSRLEVEQDKHFSLSRNKEFIEFCRGTGLRREEVTSLRGSQLIDRGKQGYYLAITGKGGRYREVQITGPHRDEIVERIRASGDGLVWEHVPVHADIHSFRSEHATSVYKAHERDLSLLPRTEKYYCRGDLKGVVYDRRAMLYASRALGHNRLSIIAGNYLRNL